MNVFFSHPCSRQISVLHFIAFKYSQIPYMYMWNNYAGKADYVVESTGYITLQTKYYGNILEIQLLLLSIHIIWHDLLFDFQMV